MELSEVDVDPLNVVLQARFTGSPVSWKLTGYVNAVKRAPSIVGLSMVTFAIRLAPIYAPHGKEVQIPAHPLNV